MAIANLQEKLRRPNEFDFPLAKAKISIYNELWVYRLLGMSNKSEKLRGNLDLLILRTLRKGPLHGYGITLHVETSSGGELVVEDGSLYPALHRLEADGLVDAEWRPGSTGRPAKYYRLTAKGRKALDRRTNEWLSFSATLTRFLQGNE